MSESVVWSPPAPQPPMRRAITDIVRSQLPRIMSRLSSAPAERFSAALDLPDPTRIELAVANAETMKFRRRTVMRVTLRGAAASARESWIVVAQVTIDRETRAALDIAVDLTSSVASAV
jgi:hypothetical protein